MRPDLAQLRRRAGPPRRRGRPRRRRRLTRSHISIRAGSRCTRADGCANPDAPAMTEPYAAETSVVHIERTMVPTAARRPLTRIASRAAPEAPHHHHLVERVFRRSEEQMKAAEEGWRTRVDPPPLERRDGGGGGRPAGGRVHGRGVLSPTGVRAADRDHRGAGLREGARERRRRTADGDRRRAQIGPVHDRRAGGGGADLEARGAAAAGRRVEKGTNGAPSASTSGCAS